MRLIEAITVGVIITAKRLRQLKKFVQRQEFVVSFGAENWRINDTVNFQSQSFGGAIHFIDYALMLARVGDDSALADFTSANLELRFDECDNASAFVQERHHDGQNLRRGQEANI